MQFLENEYKPIFDFCLDQKHHYTTFSLLNFLNAKPKVSQQTTLIFSHQNFLGCNSPSMQCLICIVANCITSCRVILIEQQHGDLLLCLSLNVCMYNTMHKWDWHYFDNEFRNPNFFETLSDQKVWRGCNIHLICVHSSPYTYVVF